MTMMRIRGIQKSFAERTILQKVEFDIVEGDRIGLVGNNGAGKTTLANLIYGKETAGRGSIEYCKKSLRIGYLLQSTEYTVNDFLTVIDVNNEDSLYEKTSLLGLDKVKEWDKDRIENLSGGEKLKLSLAKVWSTQPDVLILDEPTNHLDAKGMEWLIKELNEFSGAVIIISHDRYFLDQTVTQIIELEDGQSSVYRGNYTFYRQEKKKRRSAQLHQYEQQQKYKEQVEQQISTLDNWSSNAHKQSTKQGRDYGLKEFHRSKAKKLDKQVKSKMKRLQNELEKNKVEKPKDEEKVHFHFEDSGKRGKRIVEAKTITKSFGDRVLFSNSSFYLKYGERFGVIGDNGCGKTTFIRALVGEEHLSSGVLWKSESLKIGYLSQDVSDLCEEKTALEVLGLTERNQISYARTILANIGLTEAKIKKPIKTLSLGERTRVKLVQMLLHDVDLLILDEPTNHLDLASRESLERTLEEFKGTILVVSHDIYFLEKMCDKLLVFENQVIKRVETGFKEFKEKKENPQSMDKRKLEEELLLLQNQINTLMGKICMVNKESSEFEQMDGELTELLQRKKILTKW
ncbi:ABC-F type ribosomal protection protein [Bacillus timonensis]|nr:ABC-F type ribosomal protection protein [Bacillus timonensis]